MKPHTLTAATLLALAACGETDHDRDHDHDAASGHDHAPASKPATAPGSAPAAAATTAVPDAFALGEWKATLVPSADGLKLTAVDGAGAPVAPTGEVRIVLTGTGQEPQRVVLSPDGDGWSGQAKAAGAPGYVAVISGDVGGATQSARVTWGDVPDVAPAPKAEEPAHDDHGDEHGHGHGH